LQGLALAARNGHAHEAEAAIAQRRLDKLGNPRGGAALHDEPVA